MSEANSAYADLEKRFQRVSAVEDAIRILEWDQATMMPAGSAPARANVLAEVCTYVHELVSDPAVADLVGEAKAKGGLNEWQTANLREISHWHSHATVLPDDFTARMIALLLRS